MLKYLLLLIVVGGAIWMLTRRPAGGSRAAGGTAPPPRKEAMVACAHCGVHLPLSDCVAEGSRLYCSDQHRLAGPGEGPRR